MGVGLIGALLGVGTAAAGQRQAHVGTRIEVFANFAGTSGLGKFSFRGPFSDKGSVEARSHLTKAQLRVVETMSGKQGTLRLQWHQACKGGAGSWAILGGTGNYRGLSGGGSTTHTACPRKLTSLHGVYAGDVKGAQKAPAAPPPAPAPPAPAPPPSAPVAQSGHYLGQTSQGASIAFDVAGTLLSNLTISLVRQQCTPADLTLNADADGGSTGIAADGSFAITLAPYPTTVDQSPAVATFSIQGKLSSAGAATGALSQGSSFTSPKGVGYTCDSGPVTWTANRAA